jgi:hypothetical protein
MVPRWSMVGATAWTLVTCAWVALGPLVPPVGPFVVATLMAQCLAVPMPGMWTLAAPLASVTVPTPWTPPATLRAWPLLGVALDATTAMGAGTCVVTAASPAALAPTSCASAAGRVTVTPMDTATGIVMPLPPSLGMVTVTATAMVGLVPTAPRCLACPGLRLWPTKTAPRRPRARCWCRCRSLWHAPRRPRALLSLVSTKSQAVRRTR